MPRSIWNGAIAIGLVTVPIKVYSATESKIVHFHEVHAKDGSRIEHRRICPNDGEQVGYDDIVKGFEVAAGESVELTDVEFEEIAHGYETAKGKQVVLTDEELATAAPRKMRTIDIESFVDLTDVDPIYFDHPCILMPSGESEGTRRVPAVALRFHDEVRPTKGVPAPAKKAKPAKQELGRAVAIVEKPAPVSDLMAALGQTLDEIKASDRRVQR
jgi:DNA end-binding protein Ku